MFILIYTIILIMFIFVKSLNKVCVSIALLNILKNKFILFCISKIIICFQHASMANSSAGVTVELEER